MQTFLPFADFAQSARVLDRARCGKQRLEAYQLVRVIRYGGAWRNHPAARMWEKHPAQLCCYGLVMCAEWRQRGYADTLTDKLQAELKLILADPAATLAMPDWLGRPEIHASHRSRLLTKDPEWYDQFGWAEAPGGEYVWPVPLLTKTKDKR